MFKLNDEEYKLKIKKVLKACGEIVNLQNIQISKVNSQATSDDYIDNPKTILVLKKRGLLKQILEE